MPEPQPSAPSLARSRAISSMGRLHTVSQFRETDDSIISSMFRSSISSPVNLDTIMDPMTQRIAIAKACGWSETIHDNTGAVNEGGEPEVYSRWSIYHMGQFDRYDCTLPDYLNDPIDMAGAERLLMDGLGWLNTHCANATPFALRRTYVRYLGAILGFSCQTGDKTGYVPSDPKTGYDSIYRDIKRCAKAKPHERAEAFLRALNLWVPSAAISTPSPSTT